MSSYLAKAALLAVLYFLAGKLGQTLAVPPGYATMIWPPSGIVLAALLLYGRPLAAGVFLGSFLLNALVGHTPQELPTARELLLAACIAGGSTLQALLGHALIVRWFGWPIRLRRLADILRLTVAAVPLACLVSPTCGVAALHLLGGLPRAEIADNWLTWWTGDMFGVLVFLPLVLVISGRVALVWRDRPVRGLQAISLVLLILPLGLTFFAWKSLAETTWRQSQAHFETLVRESEQAMHARLASYASAARGGAGVLRSSQFVSPEKWRTFIDALRLREDYPGVLGLGWMQDGRMEYLEPGKLDGLAVGTDLAARPEVRAAAERAASAGVAMLTPSLMLSTDAEAAPGFLLLLPVYREEAPGTAEQRRAALRGFVFLPFQARGLFADLTPSQGRRVDVTLSEESWGATRPVFSTRVGGHEPRFTLQRPSDAFGSAWTLRWQSTAAFERSESTGGAPFVLFGGLLYTGLFAVLLVVFGARRPAVETAGALERPWILPLASFALVATASFAAWALLAGAEHAQISAQVEGETRRVEAELDRSVRMRLQTVRRMAHRWSTGGGTPYVVWRNDARDLAREVEGLERLQWIGPDYHLHWSEGTRRHGWMHSPDARANAEHGRLLRESAQRGLTYVTEPREVEPGDWVFTIYVPVSREGRFDGFIGAVFTARDFFNEVVETSAGKSFAFAMQYGGRTLFDDAKRTAANPDWKREGAFRILERRWSFTVSPTQDFVDEQQTALPVIVLVAGVLIAALSAFLVRYVLVSRLEAARIQVSAQALAASEARYELALRGMSVGLFDWNIINNDVFLSQRCRDILRITDAAFAPTYSGFTARLHPEDRPRVEKMLSGHLKRLNPFDVEFRIRRDDGEYVWVHSCGQAQFDAGGFANRMAGSMQDITPQKRQAQELELSAGQLRILIENTPAAVAMFDREMRYLMTSRRWIQDYDLEGRDLIGMSHYDVFPEIRAMPRWIDIHRRALRGERFDHCEENWTRADGRQVWNRWAIHPWTDHHGEVGGIILFTEDITARMQAEAALRTSEAMNRAAMDKAPIGTAVLDPDGRFVKVNPALCQLLGYSEEELLARDFRGIMHPDDLAADLAQLRSLLEGRAIACQIEKRYFHRDGRLIWAQLNLSAVRRPEGSVGFLVAQVQDITERKSIDRMRDEFAAVVSKELRAPLTAIRDSLADLAAARNLVLPESLQRRFDACRANSERVNALVAEILDLEKLSDGQMQLDFRDESIADLTRQVVSVSAACARITLREIDPGIVVYVDAARYAQALSNLLSNAAKFSPPDSGIEVGAEARGDWVHVYVRDQGQGVAEEFRARIFGKFAHADTEPGAAGMPGQGGAGLGLYLARQITEQMHGTIGFASRQGCGSTFWMEFPRVSCSAQRFTA